MNSARGSVIIKYEEGKSAHNQVLEVTFKAENSDFSFNTAYFFIIAKKDMVDFITKYIPVMRSEILNFGNNNNTWRALSLPISSLVSSKNEKIDTDQIEFQVQLFRHSKSGNHR